ncbi:heterokaryon incompatibility protein-domain-containing protein [Aspergillus pseudonomiae]|uniref:Heterokaryon incompatibility protein-domain-containing protein n=1 Tax=Aspergillus pseudonomiae TaxID=1506151 RepID=A0A5N7DUJ1_9EURO|nr:heterokaryon incompatibility protein-domain-containing protein [Aspergillus pseudonomiae]KAE8409955.1 heterokaryon incompatibility protein-domain-containing protein [Aspergillus pseudonomiae]
MLLYEGYLQCLEFTPNALKDEDRMYIIVRSAPGQAMDCSLSAPLAQPRCARNWGLFQILADHRNPWKTIAKISSSPRYVLTDEHRDWYLSWVQECLENHPKCQRPSAMPTRLIDLGEDDKAVMCLRDNINRKAPYIALSHNWQFSEARKSMTLKENYESRKRFLPQQGLSQTFHDTIKFTRWLGVRYLWIDTFCIIQDDPDDWAKQASQMGDIFEGAYITIAAHSGLDSSPSDGCFLERKSVREVGLPDGNGDQFSAFIIYRGYRGSDLHDLDNGPSLMRRGWCVQERLLSPRILHFRPWEVSFECFTLRHCECQKMSLGIYDGRNMHAPKSLLGDAFHISVRGQELNGNDYRYAWDTIVSIYCTADLTVPTDRLAALSSLVQRMPRQIFGDYLAGLWSKNLISELTWSTMELSKHFRHQQYVAPSFSWASIHGDAIFIDQGSYFKGAEQKACVLDAGTVPATHDPMGPIQEGFIYLRLRICEAELILSGSNPKKVELLYHSEHDQAGECCAVVDVEDDMKELEDQKVWLGELFRKDCIAGFLVMRKVAEREGVFQRIGINCYSKISRGEQNYSGHYPFHRDPERIKLI